LSKLVLVQVLRALAALSVAASHAQHEAANLAERLGRDFTRIDAFPWEAGVDVFFVISGFIMVYASERLFGTPEGRRIFLTRRIARIVPIYWAVTTLYLAIALAAPALLNSELLGAWPVIASYLFIPVRRPDGLVQPLYGLGWTLNYEMFFYVLFAAAIAWPRRQAVLGLMLTLVALAAIGLALRPLPEPLGFWTDPIILEFVFGMGLGLLYVEGARLGGAARGLLGAGALAMLSLVAVQFGAVAIGYRAFAYGIPAAMLVAGMGFGSEKAGEGGRMARLGAAIGDASYALYLIHPFVIRGGREILWRSGLGAVVGPWGAVVLTLVASLAASVAVYRAFERPVTRGLRRALGA
jgi:peptidoglycan/LPS O-acetylase OafA/YrhL